MYKQIIIPLPFNQYLSNHSRVDQIHSTPAVAKSGRKAGTAAQFDTALLLENWEDYCKFGGLKGVLYFFLAIDLLNPLILHLRPSCCSNSGHLQITFSPWILPTRPGIC